MSDDLSFRAPLPRSRIFALSTTCKNTGPLFHYHYTLLNLSCIFRLVIRTPLFSPCVICVIDSSFETLIRGFVQKFFYFRTSTKLIRDKRVNNSDSVFTFGGHIGTRRTQLSLYSDSSFETLIRGFVQKFFYFRTSTKLIRDKSIIHIETLCSSKDHPRWNLVFHGELCLQASY